MARAKKSAFFGTDEESGTQEKEAADANTRIKDAQQQALRCIYKKIQEVHVLDEAQVRALAMASLEPVGLEMDSLAKYLASVLETANGKYYQKNLASAALTSTRNLIIEILITAKNQQVKKNLLVKEVTKALDDKKVTGVDDAQIQALIENICQLKDKRVYTLK